MPALEWSAIPPILFGLWWVVFPKSVVQFYGWLGRRYYSLETKGRIPETPVIRVLGVAWLLLVLGVAWIGNQERSELPSSRAPEQSNDRNRPHR